MSSNSYDENYLLRLFSTEQYISFGERWTTKEDNLLLEELAANVSMSDIAIRHNRSARCIHSRCLDIAYKMYLQDVPIRDILQKTKLYLTPKCPIEQIEVSQKVSVISEMKTEIVELKTAVNEMMSMIKGIYEFETG
jgi:HAMP domain-containing protein